MVLTVSSLLSFTSLLTSSSHARTIYRQLFPQSCIRADSGRWQYLGFKFSNRWFTGFLARHRISLRCRTKRAQKSPEELRSTIQSWLQFNRRNTIKLPGSDCGQDIPGVKTIGRFKLSEIANVDQTPLPFENTEGRTYAQRGGRTIWVKEQRSGWSKRQASLQLTLHADEKPHTSKSTLILNTLTNLFLYRTCLDLRRLFITFSCLESTSKSRSLEIPSRHTCHLQQEGICEW